MALNKTSGTSGTTEVVTLLTAAPTESIEMGITQEGMGHILARLTDLYENPIEATVRELLSNGQDSTVLLPESARKPLEVTLPTAATPIFSVRDYGVGMNRDLIEKVYAQYGASTKRNDYRQVGAYGLGAKAPLAYCTQFTVRTTRDGITTEFEVTRTETGNFVNIISISETGEEAGTLVSIPAKLSDVHSFAAAVENYRKFSFDTELVIDGTPTVYEDFLLMESNFFLDRDEESNTEVTGRIWVRRTAIHDVTTRRFAYRYNDPSVGYVISGWAYPAPDVRSYYRNSEYDMIVELKPGVVDFTSSRDSITNNDRFARLSANVKNFVKMGSLTDLFAHARTWADEDFRTVFNCVLSYSELEEGKLVSKLENGTPVELSPSDLTNGSGVSLLEGIITYCPTVFTTGLMLSPEASFSFVTPGASRVFGGLSGALRSDTVTSGSLRVQELAQLKPVYSLYHFVNGFETEKAINSRSRMPQYAVVVGKDAKELKTLISMRRVLQDEYFKTYTALLSVPVRSKELDRQVTAIEENFGVKVTIYSLADLIAEGKKLRVAARKSRTEGSDTPMELILVTEGVETDVEAARAVSMSNTWRRHQLTPAKLKKENALLILSNEDSLLALKGAANAGVQVTNRPIYRTERSRGVRASHLKALDGYDGLVFSPRYSYGAKIVESMKVNRTYSARRLMSEVKAIDVDVVAASLLRNWYFDQEFFNFLAKRAKASNVGTALQRKILTAAGNASTGIDRNVQTFQDSDFDLVFAGNKPMKAALMNLKASIDSMCNSDSPACRLVREYSRDFARMDDDGIRDACLAYVFSALDLS